MANLNLVRYMLTVNEKLTAASQYTGSNHFHAGVRAGIGITQCGPVLEWAFAPEDEEGFGHIVILNWKGETVRKPLTDTMVDDIRPCWDGCRTAEVPPAPQEG